MMARVALLAALLALTTSAERPPNSPSNDEFSLQTLYLGSLTTGFAGTVVSADPCGTTYALTCTNSTLCPNPVTFTATGAASTYQYQLATSTSVDRGSGEASISQSCTIEGTSTNTSAICSVAESISFNGRSSTARMQITVAGNDLVYAQVPVTGNLEALAHATGVCSLDASATGSGSGAVATRVGEVYKVIIIPVGAALLAGAL